MTEIPVKAIDSFSATGGILGLIILLLVGFLIWYIHSSRKYHSAENKASVNERREWRDTVDKNTAAFHALEKALITKPCLRSPDTKTRETDRVHR